MFAASAFYYMKWEYILVFIAGDYDIMFLAKSQYLFRK